MNIARSLDGLHKLITSRSPEIYNQGVLVAALRDEYSKRLFSHGELVDYAEDLQRKVRKLQAELNRLKRQK